MFDVAYYLRGIFTAVAWTMYAKVNDSEASKSAPVLRANLLSPSISWGMCWFTDLDLMFHMNNARYLRECDFARYKFLISNGIGPALRKTGYTMVLGKIALNAPWVIIVSFRRMTAINVMPQLKQAMEEVCARKSKWRIYSR